MNTYDIKHASLFNAALAIVGWLACISANTLIAVSATLIILVLHLRFTGSWKKEREILAISLLLGSSVDSFLGNLNILHFVGESRILPPWEACIWLLLGITIRHSLSWTGRNKLAGTLFAALLGPIHYFALSQVTPLEISAPLWQSLLLFSFLSAIIINLLQAFSSVWLERYRRQKPVD